MVKYPLLKGYIELSGMSQEEFCKKIGITTRTLHNKIVGKSDFTMSEVHKITELLNYPAESIFLRKRVS